eukprot:Lithocolla_globosa_v1_NODE_641_length_3531_cov_128.763809.p5 type:complete len:144 gc:universal NODE_641_length_3531_cov_128.763809:1852-2283(+)
MANWMSPNCSFIPGVCSSSTYSAACFTTISPNARGLTSSDGLPCFAFGIANSISVSRAARSAGVLRRPFATSPRRVAYAFLHGMSCNMTLSKSPVHSEKPGAPPELRLLRMIPTSLAGSITVIGASGGNGEGRIPGVVVSISL